MFKPETSIEGTYDWTNSHSKLSNHAQNTCVSESSSAMIARVGYFPQAVIALKNANTINNTIGQIWWDD